MPKRKPKAKSIADAVGERLAKHGKTSTPAWWTKITPAKLKAIEEIRERYLSGGYGHTPKAVICRAAMSLLKLRPAPTEKRFAEWLSQRD